MGKNLDPATEDKEASDVTVAQIGFKGVVLAAVITAITTLLVALTPIVFKLLPLPSLTPSSTPEPTQTPNPPDTPTLTPIPLVACPYEGSTDEQTFVNLIQAEAEAVDQEAMDIIHQIFAPDAVFTDVKNGTSWPNPVARFEGELFPNANLSDVKHFGILFVGKSPDGKQVYYVSGSSGSYTNEDGGPFYYVNGSKGNAKDDTKYGSDHWTFQQNAAGCWVISQFEFNAGDAPFPP